MVLGGTTRKAKPNGGKIREFFEELIILRDLISLACYKVMSNVNTPAPGAPFYTPYQNPAAGTAVVPQASGKAIPKLFQPLKIRGLELQNRIFVEFRPLPDLTTFGGIVSRGPGLTLSEAVAVVPEGRITPQDAGIWSDAHADALKPVVDFAHSQNQKIGIQLAHAGRKASCNAPWLDCPNPVATEDVDGWPDNVWAPSPIPFHPSYPQPKELTKDGIKNVVNAFVEAAKRAVKIGFDVIEIHSAHGYLLSSFLSPTSNRRTDDYGGSFENRTRLLIEIVDGVRAVIPQDMPLFVRVSGTEWLEEVLPLEESWTVEDTCRLAVILAEHGVDLFDVSAGGIDSRQKIRSGPEYQVPFAAAAKEAVGSKMLVSAVGGLWDGKVASGVLESGKADVIFVGRQFQKNPGLVWSMADDLDVQIYSARQIQWGFRGRGIRFLGTNKKEADK
ncbi:NADH:flavin oxidoreductase [Psilocybe cubensis]|uniref:NADH:flavin oxidoreductase n=2 Tax=Psilocybe cubensis TaxID=181762 RepID=A0ACB8GID2_PSICU|nr:NADH:flavin oxidoreductase [Psilocybe cubensis]KAH9474971.1 NADH:flavin oxidoreductase [Psilocybe cubensis]